MTTTIDIDTAFNIALVGIKRACVFMGIGFHVGKQSRVDFHLDGAEWLKIIPDEVPPDTVTEFRDEFVAWTLGNGIRELVETFEVFLDALFNSVLYIEAWHDAKLCNQLPEAEYHKKLKKFHHGGIRAKFVELQKRFAVDSKVIDYLESMGRTRNCLTHRLGIVSTKDLNGNGQLRVSWCAGELYGYHEDGNEFVPTLDTFPIDFPKGSPVKFRQAQRYRSFVVGNRISFESKELKEICYTFHLAVQNLESTFIEFAKGCGVTINETNPMDSLKTA